MCCAFRGRRHYIKSIRRNATGRTPCCSPARSSRCRQPTSALKGRAEPIPTAKTHFLNKRALKGPYPEGLETAIFGFGCFWGAERKFWEMGDGIWVTAVGYAGGVTPNPTYEEVCSGRTGHNEVVLVVFDPKKVSYEALLKTFWESHDPTQGMRQGNDVGTQYRSGIYVDVAGPAQRRGGLQGGLSEGAVGQRLRPDHDRDRRRAAVLFRRGLSPAVPGQGAARLLRPWRHGAELSGGRWRQGRGVRSQHQRAALNVIPGLVPGIHLPACSRVRGWLDPGDKRRDDRRGLWMRQPTG